MSSNYAMEMPNLVSKKVPSADPEIRRAADEMRQDPKAYFDRHRTAAAEQASREIDLLREQADEEQAARRLETNYVRRLLTRWLSRT